MYNAVVVHHVEGEKVSELSTSTRSNEDRTPRQKVSWSLLDIILAVVLGCIVGIILILVLGLIIGISGASLTSIQSLAITGTLLYASVAGGVWLFVVKRRDVGWSQIGFSPMSPWIMLVAPAAFVVLVIANIVVASIISQILGSYQNPQINQIAPNGRLSAENFVWLFVLVAIIAPPVEEMVFRGLLYRWVRSKLGVIAAVLITAALFAAAHLIPILFPVLFVTGIVLAIMAERFKSIYASMLVHALNNGLFTLALFLAPNITK